MELQQLPCQLHKWLERKELEDFILQDLGGCKVVLEPDIKLSTGSSNSGRSTLTPLDMLPTHGLFMGAVVNITQLVIDQESSLFAINFKDN